MNITAQDLKTRGSRALKEGLKNNPVLFIQVRGKEEYAVIPRADYNEFCEYQLEKALREVREDMKHGRYKTSSAEEHLKRVTA